MAVATPSNAVLVVASSMPVRDLDFFAPVSELAGPGPEVLSNRGVNGIDGVISTALGVAAGRRRPVVALLGDLCFLHDAGGLLGATAREIDVTFVVVDNDGGGIFSFLAQAGIPEHFEALFGTPHGIDIAALAAVHGVPVDRVRRPTGVGPAVVRCVAAGGVRVVLVSTDRIVNVERHREVWDAAAREINSR